MTTKSWDKPCQYIPVSFDVPMSCSDRAFKLLNMELGPLTLLISDASENFASAAACLAVGSHDDPDNVLGLAHLCEHMVFFGTREFPEPNSFEKFLEENGGSFNAYTSAEKTCYAFSIPARRTTKLQNNKKSYEPCFDYALQNFASFFKNPLFHEKHIKLEIDSIHTEHQYNVKDAGKILFYSLKLLANQNHQFSRFATGSSDTFRTFSRNANTKLSNELHGFFQETYKNNRICLVLKGPQSLIYLQKLAKKVFGNFYRAQSGIVHSWDKSFDQLSILRDTWRERYQTDIYGTSNLRQLLIIKSHIDQRLRVFFPLKILEIEPELAIFLRSWIRILGEEKKGSLASELINHRNLASLLYLFSETITSEDRLLCVDIAINQQGLRHINEIIVLLFRFLQKSMETSIDSIALFLRESFILEKMAYSNSDKCENSIEEISSIAENLLEDFGTLKTKNLIKGYYGWDDLNSLLHTNDRELDTPWKLMAAKFLHSTKILLSVYNFNAVVLVDPENIRLMNSITAKSKIVQRDPFYNFEYEILEFRPTQVYEQTIKVSDSFSFPSPNAYLDTCRQYFKEKSKEFEGKRTEDAFDFSTQNLTITSAPKLLKSSKGFELWYKQEIDLSFKSKVMISFKMESLKAQSSVTFSVALDIISELLGNTLREDMYSAEELGYAWGIFPSLNGSPSIGFTLIGHSSSFNHITKDFIRIICSRLRSIRSALYQEFKRVRVKLRHQYSSSNLFGTKLAIGGSIAFLEENIWSIEDRLEALEEIDSKYIGDACLMMLDGARHISALIEGDINPSEVNDYSILIENLVQDSNHSYISNQKEEFHPISSLNLSNPSSYILSEGTSYAHEMNASLDDPLNTIFYFIQIGIRDNIFVRTIGAFLSFLFKSHLLPILRHEYKLGYNVFCGQRIFRNSLGIYVSAMCPTCSGITLYNCVEGSIQKLDALLESFSNERTQELTQQFISGYEHSAQEDYDVWPSNTLYAAEPLVHTSNYPSGNIYKIHKNFWEKIVSKTYRFKGQYGKEEIDVKLLKGITRVELYLIFRQFVSLKSNKRATLALIVKSNTSNNENNKKKLKTQLQNLANGYGCDVSHLIIDQIIERSKYDCREAVRLLEKYVGRDLNVTTNLSVGDLEKNSPKVGKDFLSNFKGAMKRTKMDSYHAKYSNPVFVRDREELQKNCTLFSKLK